MGVKSIQRNDTPRQARRRRYRLTLNRHDDRLGCGLDGILQACSEGCPVWIAVRQEFLGARGSNANNPTVWRQVDL
jgi:hypothetical protein